MVVFSPGVTTAGAEGRQVKNLPDVYEMKECNTNASSRQVQLRMYYYLTFYISTFFLLSMIEHTLENIFTT